MSGHEARFWIRNWNPTVWRARCGEPKHVSFQGSSYEEVEDLWREHVYEQTGKAPKPLGDTTIPRWKP